MKIYLIMALLFGMIIGFLDIGIDLNIFEFYFSILGFWFICILEYENEKEIK